MEVSCPYFDPDFENFYETIYGPRVYVDNESCDACTVGKVNTLDKQELLVEVLQVLTDMDLFITKSYISSDAGWFMDVFHVKDHQGNKVYDKKVIGYVQQAIVARREHHTSEVNSLKVAAKSEFSSECTAIEMIGPNRPGLFSEISAVLVEQRCNVVKANAWSHNDCLACVAFVSDESTSTYINDPDRLAAIEDHLSTVLRPSSSDDHGVVKAHFLGCVNSMNQTETERRLHQLMFANRDFDWPSGHISPTLSAMNTDDYDEERRKTRIVSIDRCNEKRYSIVNVECMDRPKLMFDTVCTLTDLNYVVFHASIASHGPFASQEYYIRHKDGRILDSADERQLVVKCLEAAIERRICEGVRLELCTENSFGLLSYITRVLRENGLTVAQADIATQGEKAKNVFYVQDISGNKVNMEIVESIQRELKSVAFQVKNELLLPQKYNLMEKDGDGFSFVSLIKSQLDRISHSFISI